MGSGNREKARHIRATTTILCTLSDPYPPKCYCDLHDGTLEQDAANDTITMNGQRKRFSWFVLTATPTPRPVERS
jgi:hypothetical protein